MGPPNLTASITGLKIAGRSIHEKSRLVKINHDAYRERSKHLLVSVELIEEIVMNKLPEFDVEPLVTTASEVLQTSQSTDHKAGQVLKQRNGILGFIKSYLIQWWKLGGIRNELETVTKQVDTLRNQLLIRSMDVIIARTNAFISSLGEDRRAAKRLGIPEMTTQEIEVALSIATANSKFDTAFQLERSYYALKARLLQNELPADSESSDRLTTKPEQPESALDFEMEQDEVGLQEYDPISRPGSALPTGSAIENEKAILGVIRVSHRLRESVSTTSTSDLVNSLCDLALGLSALHWQDDGLTTCHWIKKLAYFFALEKHELAASLKKLSSCLAHLGKDEERHRIIQDAVRIYRELVKAHGEQFKPHLARALNNSSFRSADLDQHEGALSAMQEAVGIFRELKLQPETAMSLYNLSTRLEELDKSEDALKAEEEAIQIYRDLAKDQPAKYMAICARSLNDYSFKLSGAYHPDKALEAIEEAVERYEALASDLSLEFSPSLTVCLNNLSIHLSGLDRHDEELRATEKAVRISRQLAGLQPVRFKPLLTRSLWHLVAGLTHAGHAESCRETIEEAMSLERELLARDST